VRKASEPIDPASSMLIPVPGDTGMYTPPHMTCMYPPPYTTDTVPGDTGMYTPSHMACMYPPPYTTDTVPGETDGPSGVLVCAENKIAYKKPDHEDVVTLIPRDGA